ncbi:MAG: hypothetical protein ACLSVD_13925 [Eggerthellaceae bacterium]
MALKKGRVVFDGAPHLLDEAAIADIYGTNEEAEAGSDFGERKRSAGRRAIRLSNARGGSRRLGKRSEGFSSPEEAA